MRFFSVKLCVLSLFFCFGCLEVALVGPIPEVCTDNLDNDEDTFVDCFDLDCNDDPACAEQGNCADNLDNDADNFIDCRDGDCSQDPACLEQGNCTDNLDNDVDTFVDCADSDCVNDPSCQSNVCGDNTVVFPEECDPPNNVSCDQACQNIPEAGRCNDDVDNDLDNLVDCQDVDCVTDPACPFGNVEICNDLADDDGDGLVDCEDPDCAAACAGGTRVTGDPCLGPADCGAAPGNNPFCIAEIFGFPSGYCAEQCNPNVPTCVTGTALSGQPADGVCVDQGQGNGICLDLCNPANGDADCRSAYDCVSFGLIAFCLPGCQSDADCPQTGHCDTNPQSDNFGSCSLLEVCDNLQDEDFDGLLDCLDPDCAQNPLCQPGGNPTGDPCNTQTQCSANASDPFCFDEAGQGFPSGYCSEFCDPSVNDCANGATCLDISGDNSVGLCLDDCNLNNNPPQSDCRDGYVCFDLIGNGQGSCFPFCTEDAQCPTTGYCEILTGRCEDPETCDDGFDNDGDELIDCEDAFNCAEDPACQETGRCDDTLDNDLDGEADCQDFDCLGDPSCIAICGDGVITVPETCDPPNNISCDQSCRVILEAAQCDDNQDNDGDGFIDCQDTDCVFNPLCPFGATEVCDDFFDDDGDGLVDCADPDCAQACAGGTGVTGDPCLGAGDCATAAGNTPQCLNETLNGFPGGYCSEFCDLATPSCVTGTSTSGQPADGFCADVGLGTGEGLCLDQCDLDNGNDDCRDGYVCFDALGVGLGLCVPFCTTDADCPQTGHCDTNPQSDSFGSCTIIENCVNGIDDERDGATDCDDEDCFGTPTCPLAVCGDGTVTAPEICDPPDNIGCDQNCQRILEGNACTDAQDNDGDGFTDCEDVDCFDDAACPFGQQEICNDFIDDDGDLLVDCFDPDCFALCQGDNNGVAGDPCLGPGDCDALVQSSAQCLDEATNGFPGGYCSELCLLVAPLCVGGTNQAGQPADGVCKDVGGGAFGLCFDACVTTQDCREGYLCFDLFNDNAPVCTPFCTNDDQCPQTGNCDINIGACVIAENCTNGLDEDRDGLIDCADSGCVDNAACPDPVCGDGVISFPEQCEPPDGVTCDQNCNLLAPQEFCQNTPNDLSDDDSDGLSDCADPDCQFDAECQLGAGATGSACANHNECNANTGQDPACLVDAASGVFPNGFPGGYCSEFCTPGGGNDCEAGARCRDVGLGNGLGLCFDSCNNNNQCRAGYTCSGALGGGGQVCIPQ